ncbi:DUF6461 domain-containing protein [Streptomyces sp. NPDC048272]|uniref:DUF6461 domain-containing protein n=1 Tax=Streptomyces sp. NPDC048272 TaxID=3154616 RepID=UPI003442C132
MLYEDDAYVVTAGRYGSWVWVWEHGSWLCVEDDDLLGELSAGTAALSLHVNEKPLVDFRYAENGQLVTGLHTLLGIEPQHRTGQDPHRFDSELRALGAQPDTGETGPLGMRGLFYRLTEGLGAGLDQADLHAETVLSARLRPHPDRVACVPDLFTRRANRSSRSLGKWSRSPVRGQPRLRVWGLTAHRPDGLKAVHQGEQPATS